MRYEGAASEFSVATIFGINDAYYSSYKRTFITQEIEEVVKKLCSDSASSISLPGNPSPQRTDYIIPRV